MSLFEVEAVREHMRSDTPGDLWLPGDRYVMTAQAAREGHFAGFVRVITEASPSRRPGDRVTKKRILVGYMESGSWYILSDGSRHRGSKRAAEALGISEAEVRKAARALPLDIRVATIAVASMDVVQALLSGAASSAARPASPPDRG